MNIKTLTFLVFSALAANNANAGFMMSSGVNDNLPIDANDYSVDLINAGYETLRSGGQLSVDQAGWITFSFIAAESLYSNTFTVTESGSGNVYSITEGANQGAAMTSYAPDGQAGYAPIVVQVSAGEIINMQFSNNANNVVVDNTQPRGFLTDPGHLYDLGIFFYNSPNPLNEVMLAYDDRYAWLDPYNQWVEDNHDDMLVHAVFSSVYPVPVPAAIWLLVSGMAGWGVMARRKP